MEKRFIQPLRLTVAWGFLLFQLWLVVRFVMFVRHFRSGGAAPFVPRPDGIEGFLPISALLGLKGWIVTGAVNVIHPAALVVFLSVIAVSLLLKRSFCSWICPVGTLSELLWKGGGRIFGRNVRVPRLLDIALRGLKYLLLAFFLISILWTMDPGQVAAFIYSDYNRVADVRLLDFFMHPSPVPFAVILLLALLSLPMRIPVCRFLCPYGALLGLFSVLSPVKVTRTRDLCTRCGACSRACPSGIPVMEKEKVSSEECIGCWRCISQCPAPGALEMKPAVWRRRMDPLIFAILVIGIFYGGTLIGRLTGHWHTAVSYGEYARLLGP